MKPETMDKVLTLISLASEDELHEINDAVRAAYSSRRAQTAAKAYRELEPGDEAYLVNIRPRYMEGVRVRILSRRQTKFNVEVLGYVPPWTRFGNSKTLIVAPTCLRKITTQLVDNPVVESD